MEVFSAKIVLTFFWYLLYISYSILELDGDSKSVFLRNSILYLTLTLYIYILLHGLSKKKKIDLDPLFNKIQVDIFLGKFIFILVILSSMPMPSTYSWVWSWLATFASQVLALHFFCFFFKSFHAKGNLLSLWTSNSF